LLLTTCGGKTNGCRLRRRLHYTTRNYTRMLLNVQTNDNLRNNYSVIFVPY